MEASGAQCRLRVPLWRKSLSSAIKFLEDLIHTRPAKIECSFFYLHFVDKLLNNRIPGFERMEYYKYRGGGGGSRIRAHVKFY